MWENKIFKFKWDGISFQWMFYSDPVFELDGWKLTIIYQVLDVRNIFRILKFLKETSGYLIRVKRLCCLPGRTIR